MLNTHRLHRTARSHSAGGFTLVELLVVIGIIAILAGVALGPIMGGIEKAKESSGVQVVRQISLLMFSYANDNNQTYLPGSGAANPMATPISTSEGIANALLNNSYVSDATIFAITSSKKYTGTAAPYALLTANLDWDFTGGATSSTGITSTASDQLPLIYSTGGAPSSLNTASATTTITSSGAAPAPYQLNGIAVAYKSNNAVFIKAAILTSSTAKASNFISASFNDTSTYTQIKP